MDIKEEIKNIFKEDNIIKLSEYSSNTIGNVLVDILDDELSSFSYDKEEDINYLNSIIKELPKYIPLSNVGQVDEKLKNIHQKIKVFLVQKPGYIDKKNSNYKLFKNMINDIELMQMSILYDYVDKYQGSKYQLINYIIFELKNISVFEDALIKFPYLVNYFDKDDTNLIISVTDAYISKVMKYTKEKGIDDIIYFDQIITSIMKSEEFRFDVIDKQTILKKIRDSFENIKGEKSRKIFYLNSLTEKINGKEEILTNSYLEYKYKINTYFNESVNSEVRRVIDSYSMSKDRNILEDYILSFDKEDTREIDDALSVKILDNGNLLLGVHIADPLDLIDENSIIFEEAAKRTTSIYLSDKAYSMFPNEIGTDLISLKEKNYRPATTYYFEFNKRGRLVNYDFIRSIVKVNRNLTYNDFNTILNNNYDDKLGEVVNNLSKVSSYLQKYYTMDPLYQELNRGKSNITGTNITGLTCGEKTVENSMVFTNHMVAKFFKDNNLPFIFRNHNLNKDALNRLEVFRNKISKEKNSNSYVRYIDMIKNMYPQAVYGVECKGHEGLGLKEYCHITSPLRRMADVIGLICLDKLYFNDFDNETKNNVKKLVITQSRNINKKKNSIEKFSEEYERLKRGE